MNNDQPAIDSEVDPRALREELGLADPADVQSSGFQRFVIRLSEALNVDIPPHDYSFLTTLSGCQEYLATLGQRARGGDGAATTDAQVLSPHL